MREARGESDPYAAAWPGNSLVESAQLAHADLRRALVAEVLRRCQQRPVPAHLRDLDLPALTRRKTQPMVRGLFPRAEHDAVRSLVERSVVFLTGENIGTTLLECQWPRSAWDIANLYLGSVDAELLGEDALQIVGLSEHTTCFVSISYFEEEDPFADFLVHEVAHIFHNCKRRTARVRSTPRREWLLDIEFRKRETFAYSCEAYARIVERTPRLRERTALAQDFAREARVLDERVDPGEVADIVREASDRRNGWKVILKRCAPSGSG